MDKPISAKIITLPEAYEMAYSVSRKITHVSDRFDIIVGISRGGFPPARMICDFLNIKTLTSIQVRHYTSAGKARKNVAITERATLNFNGKNVLIVDDVNDSGKTLKVAYEHIYSLEPKQVKTAVLHEKKDTSFNADFTGAILSEWRWLTYQWAVAEDLLEFLNRDDMLQEDEEEIIKHLNNKYNLEADSNLIKKVMSMKDNYHSD